MEESHRLCRLQGILTTKMLITLNRSKKNFLSCGMHHIEGMRTELAACPTEVRI